jgi:hypothetical protein
MALDVKVGIDTLTGGPQKLQAFRIVEPVYPDNQVPAFEARERAFHGHALFGGRGFRAALGERTRERVPLQWAGTQMNLG